MKTTQSNRPSIPESVTFPTSLPYGVLSARIELGQSLRGAPTWDIRTLNIGPLRSAPEYNQHLRDTVGSSYDWSDEFRFDRRFGLLSSFVLKTPEDGGVERVIAESWLALPRDAGLPAIENRAVGFHIDPLDLRYLSDSGSQFVAADRRVQVADYESLRLAICPDVDLLFQRGNYCGWILANPIAHLVVAPSYKPSCSSNVSDPELVGCLCDYLALVVQPNIDRMNEGDPEIRRTLKELGARVDSIKGPAALAIRRRVEEVLEIFYPER